MNFLPENAIDAIARHDWSVHGAQGLPNRTRFYRYLLPADNDMEVHIVACKTGGAKTDRRIVVKEVVRASVDDPWVYVKDVACGMICGYSVDWSPEGLGRNHYWSYNGEWGTEVFARGKWMIACTVLNPEALGRHDRFRYCAWTPACGDIVKYLKVYAKHPKAELLAKSGLGRFGQAAGFVAQLERDKALARFLLANADDVRKLNYGVDVIRKAHKLGVSLADASRAIEDRRRFRQMHLPLELDASKALEYIALERIEKYNYCLYAKNVKALGLDLRDTKNAFPKRFKHRERVVADQVAERKRREDARLAAQQDAIIAAAAKRYAKVERASPLFRMLLPRCSAELVREGRRMHNCLGDGHYAGRIARGESVIAFVRRKSFPRSAFVAVEYSLDKQRIQQCYGAKNSPPPAAARAFAERAFKVLPKIAEGGK